METRLTFALLCIVGHCAIEAEQVYDSENETRETEIGLDTPNSSTAKTVIFSRGSVMMVRISKILEEGFSLYVSASMKELVETSTSKYKGNIISPRYTITTEPKTYEMVKNLRLNYTIRPRFGSSISMNISELSLTHDCIQLVHVGQAVRKMNNSVNYNMTSDKIQILLDSNKTISPRGEGFILAYEVCGGESSDGQANISLPTPLFYGFDKRFRCSYVYSSSRGYAPILSLTTKTKASGTQLKDTSVELCIDNVCIFPSGNLSLENFTESYVGNSSGIAVIFSYDSSPALMHPVVFANFSIRKSDCIVHLQGNMGIFSSETYQGKYPNNFHCTYIIKATPKATVRLNLSEVDLAQTDCGDFIQVIDFGNVTTMCNSSTLVHTSVSNEIKIVFGTDREGTAKGFTAYWEVLTENQAGAELNIGMKMILYSVVAVTLLVAVINL